MKGKWNASKTLQRRIGVHADIGVAITREVVICFNSFRSNGGHKDQSRFQILKNVERGSANEARIFDACGAHPSQITTKAAEDCRTPRRFASQAAFNSAVASWRVLS